MDTIQKAGDSPAAVLRDLADKMGSEEIRTFYLFTVDKKGVARNTMFVTPNMLVGPSDLNAMGDAAVHLCDLIDRTLNPKLPGLA